MYTLLLLASVAVGAEPHTLDQLGFLAGRWSDGAFTAWYTAPDPHGILSYSEVVKDGEVVFHEFERFHRDGDGVRYLPYPSGKPADGFALVGVESGRAVFANPDKDWPRRIVFERAGSDRVGARPGADDRLVITLGDPDRERVQVLTLTRQPAAP